MSEHLDRTDDTWENFFGTTTDLMPSIMGVIDAIWDANKSESSSGIGYSSSSTTSDPSPRISPSRTVSNFATSLSPNVQKLLQHVTNAELDKDHHQPSLKQHHNQKSWSRSSTDRASRSQRSVSSVSSSTNPSATVHKSTESLDIISECTTPNVQKMLSNLPDTDLVIGGGGASNGYHHDGKHLVRNSSFLHSSTRLSTLNGSNGFVDECDDSFTSGGDNDKRNISDSMDDYGDDCHHHQQQQQQHQTQEVYSPKPLGSYLHTTPSGIASRTPVGRKNLGKYLQVPSDSSSEVSRPVSMTSLGSCSSGSSGGGPHQPSSAYLASAESLDSDPEPSGSQGSADSGIAEQPTMSPEQRVLQEMLDTESVYVSDLEEVIEGYLRPWKDDPECPFANDLKDLFSNLEEIYSFNKSFLEELRIANSEPSPTANVFLRNDKGFSVYTEYCTNYPRTMAVLGELTRDEKIAALFREKQLLLGHALPLGSYLLKPVQRILKYHLFMQRLSKQCEPNHKPTIDLALATMTSVASHINSMKRKHEHAVRVQEIQSQLYGWTGPDLTALGELIAEGTFRVGGARGRRHVFLFDKLLLMAKNKPDGSLAYKTHIMCSNLMLVESVRGEPLSFHILPFDNPRLQCTLRARSPQHKREWTLQLKRVILENYSAVIPSHARQLVMQLGQDTPDTEEPISDKWSSPVKQHSAPQYLERRSRVRKSRDFSNRRATSQDRTFPGLASWRRKSEPNVVQQYNTKTLPKKITKLKKAKDRTAKFYTDLSDNEMEAAVCESNDSLLVLETQPEMDECGSSIGNSSNNISGSNTVETKETKDVKQTLEEIVSQLLMQKFPTTTRNPNRNRANRDSEPGPSRIWMKQESNEDLPSKADSLPRSFQLNEIIENNKEDGGKGKEGNSPLSLPSNTYQEDLQENDMSSQLDDNDMHPDHRIYRKSMIRFSLVQRIRTIISEESQRTNKLPTYKQGSKSMGAKIAQPDYADPHKLFSATTTTTCSSLSSSMMDCHNLSESTMDCSMDMMGEREELDMTINEAEVLSSVDKICSEFESSKIFSDTGQYSSLDSGVSTNSSHSSNNKATNGTADFLVLDSSHTNCSDSFYESRLEESLKEVTRSESFKSSDSAYTATAEINGNCTETTDCHTGGTRVVTQIFNSNVPRQKPLVIRKKPNLNDIKPKSAPSLSIHQGSANNNNINCNDVLVGSPVERKRSVNIKRPTKAPPPIPTKPNRLSTNSIATNETTNTNCTSNTKGWVKTVVGRFE